MKTPFLLASLVLSLAAATAAQAQGTPPAAPAGATAPAAAPSTAPAPKDFATRKADMMGRIDHQMADLTAMRDCVNAAASPADLKTCHRNHEHGGMRHRHAPA